MSAHRSNTTLWLTAAEKAAVKALAASQGASVSDLLRASVDHYSRALGRPVVLPPYPKSRTGNPRGWRHTAESRERMRQTHLKMNAERRQRRGVRA